MKLLLYCTKAKPYLYDLRNIMGKFGGYNVRQNHLDHLLLNGKIVAECDFEVERLQIVYGKGWETKTIKGTENIEKLTCLSRDKLYQYCKGNGYAIHIKNLHIFDDPKKLTDYHTIIDMGGGMLGTQNKLFTSAPRNMMRVSQNYWKYGFYNPSDIDILISIKPQWLYKILNGEKTIEVRKKVLREMLK